ncbi:hypothetical protein KIN20_015708 [Parelaphostrongylus tenuis]|uniref:Uncharacterized protein n=1 Tax=Parelaphostrongylus tenuis TaxID=148309 RepID=A0AAD5QP83_PARTN|nr:hypothetical protein KIN20_015708 [Parelaphostrongylus tenuis]
MPPMFDDRRVVEHVTNVVQDDEELLTTSTGEKLNSFETIDVKRIPLKPTLNKCLLQ